MPLLYRRRRQMGLLDSIFALFVICALAALGLVIIALCICGMYTLFTRQEQAVDRAKSGA